MRIKGLFLALVAALGILVGLPTAAHATNVNVYISLNGGAETARSVTIGTQYQARATCDDSQGDHTYLNQPYVVDSFTLMHLGAMQVYSSNPVDPMKADANAVGKLGGNPSFYTIGPWFNLNGIDTGGRILSSNSQQGDTFDSYARVGRASGWASGSCITTVGVRL